MDYRFASNISADVSLHVKVPRLRFGLVLSPRRNRAVRPPGIDCDLRGKAGPKFFDPTQRFGSGLVGKQRLVGCSAQNAAERSHAKARSCGESLDFVSRSVIYFGLAITNGSLRLWHACFPGFDAAYIF